jgi:hypothetical protein
MTNGLDKPLRKAARGPRKHRRKMWSPERRARQSGLIRASQPWQKSTGPRSDAGKIRAASNALKHGFRSRPFIERVREERRLVREAARTIALAKHFLRALRGIPAAGLHGKLSPP